MPKIDYIPVGDYLLPAITLRDPPDAEPLTKYGMMRKRHLKEYHKIAYGLMLNHEELYPHCRAIQRAAEERMDELLAQLVQTNPPPDKIVCGLSWAQHMAGLHHSAEEIIFAELIYA
ncbi:MAG: TnpV protein [Defluviitaleaceae bacterium]|nr:TnpV protein [Defluviitaleaceae bacterium]